MKKNSKYITLAELDKEMGWTPEELAEMKKETDEIIKRMNLKEVREKAKMTQEELAKRSGIPRASISRIENGFRNVTIKKLGKIAKAMDMEIEITFKQSSK